MGRPSLMGTWCVSWGQVEGCIHLPAPASLPGLHCSITALPQRRQEEASSALLPPPPRLAPANTGCCLQCGLWRGARRKHSAFLLSLLSLLRTDYPKSQGGGCVRLFLSLGSKGLGHSGQQLAQESGGKGCSPSTVGICVNALGLHRAEEQGV